MSDRLQLIPIGEQDLPLWNEFREALYKETDAKELAREAVLLLDNPTWHLWFAQRGNEVIGLVELSERNVVDGCLTSPVAYLEGLYLRDGHRGLGLGAAIVDQLVSWSRKRGFAEFATDTELTNEGAQRFYRRLGFEEVDRVVSFRLTIPEA